MIHNKGPSNSNLRMRNSNTAAGGVHALNASQAFNQGNKHAYRKSADFGGAGTARNFTADLAMMDSAV